MKINSLCVRELGEPRTTEPHILPLHLTSSFVFENVDQGIDIFTGKTQGHVYGRYGNPTVDAVADKIAKLEGFGLNYPLYGLMVSSGMSAISTLTLALMKQGEAILTQGNLYGGTTELFQKVLAPLGIQTIMTDLRNLDEVEKLLANNSNISMLYYETPANPTLACVDIQALSALAGKYGKISVADNTFCTPLLQQPFHYGTDYVIHSTTKYLNGHGNSIAGVIVGKDETMMKGRVWQVMKLAGTNANPFDAWLTHNGMKTLALRMEKHNANALAIATFLEQHPRVVKVNYPGLPSHPDHELAKRQMKGFGGMLSFELDGGLEEGIRFMNAIQFCTLAPTLGDVDTLILHPASMSHINVQKEIRLQYGITDGLIRLSVGIEDVSDIIQDLDQAIRH